MNCEFCGGICFLLGSIPFDRNNAGVPVINSTPMEYFKCNKCHSITCPEMQRWPSERFAERVYNSDYIKYDPDYTGVRSKNYSEWILKNIAPSMTRGLSHLDYGSGEGHLSKHLQNNSWNTTFYDPYSMPSEPNGIYNIITAIEVVEHSTNIRETFAQIRKYLAKNGVLLFSTLLADKDKGLDWWYIGARNGHISIASEDAMKILAKEMGMRFKSIGPNMHILVYDKTAPKYVLGWDVKW